ncbi:flavoprotein [Amycolatopsis sp. FBCC-B4732]|uniref:flavoprotein n=1 Tax=Amycolatopsis sp. FBCC-B4732 TaxID=3079339 RepID=UPI001FF3E365|nr:flavoprotein [Amycolatopsis sp. FBCC-B4732]UOX84578.1 flavoprotein [Amycolatopsis sp. FBCC-B4732]
MRTLGLVAGSCGGLDVRFAAELARPAAERGWRTAITLTPTAMSWLESAGALDEVAACSDLPVRSVSRLPGEPRPHPDPEVFLFAPASANSVAKLALGIADNQALTVLGDVLGAPGITIVVAYQIQQTRVHHPAWQRHLDTLSEAGVTLHRLDPRRSWTEALDLLP